MNLKQIEVYFQNRVGELRTLAERGDPWVFLCASSFIEYLAKITSGNATSSGTEYKNFLTNSLFRACPAYASFRYASGRQDLADQMYHVLRCGIVHSFSLFPDPSAKGKHGGRPRSIVIAHRQLGLAHLQLLFDKKQKLDAAVFIAQDFVEDISTVVTFVFSTARTRTPTGQQLRNNMRSWTKQYPPIGSLLI